MHFLIKTHDCVQKGKLLISAIVRRIIDGHGHAHELEHEMMIVVIHQQNGVVMLSQMALNNAMMVMMLDEMDVVLLVCENLVSISVL